MMDFVQLPEQWVFMLQEMLQEISTVVGQKKRNAVYDYIKESCSPLGAWAERKAQ